MVVHPSAHRAGTGRDGPGVYTTRLRDLLQRDGVTPRAGGDPTELPPLAFASAFDLTEMLTDPGELAPAQKLLTMRELAERAGVSLSTVHLTETGQTAPRIPVIRKLSAALNVQPGEIMEFAAVMGLIDRAEAKERD